MNFLDTASTAHDSTRAAAAAAVASDARRFREYARALFEYQRPEGGPGLTDDELISLGRTIGITDPSFASEIQEGTSVPARPDRSGVALTCLSGRHRRRRTRAR